MALTYRALYRNCRYFHNITQPAKWSVNKSPYTRIISSGIAYPNVLHQPPTLCMEVGLRRQWSSVSGSTPPPHNPEQEPTKKPGLVQRFKEMYRDYWYVLLPVHLCTSAIWFGCFYYTVRSGVDVIGLLESLGFSEAVLSPLKNSGAGYFAFAFALYKLATPLRYAVTVGGTTYAIKRFTTLGWIKPVPSRERLKEMLQEKKENIQDRLKEGKQHYQAQMKEKKTQMMDEMNKYKLEMRNMKKKGGPEQP